MLEIPLASVTIFLGIEDNNCNGSIPEIHHIPNQTVVLLHLFRDRMSGFIVNGQSRIKDLEEFKQI